MFLKRLDIQGFKTFATRTIFDFGSGVSAIVGPNGSGKSNIADAVRWALGEQNPRAVRCRHGEDVIFAGSSRRAPVGMAEVSLTFDNTTGWLPIDYAEVAITRRAYRSGENEYLINGARVRLRDVADLLRRASLEAGGHVVVGQGVVDAVLSQRAEERRALVESLAGLRHYYVRRDEAESRLRATETNLDSIRAVIAENEPLLATLAQQAEVARAYTAVRDELHSVLRLTYAHQQRALLVRREEAATRAIGAREELSRFTASAGEIQTHLSEATMEEQAAVAELAALEADLRRAETAREEAERDLAVARARAESGRRQFADIGADLARLSERITHTRGDVERTATALADASAGARHCDVEARELTGREAEIEIALRLTSGVVRQAEEAASALRRDDETARRELGAASTAALRARDEARVLEGALQRAEQALEVATRGLAAAEPHAAARRNEMAVAAVAVERATGTLAAASGAEKEAALRVTAAQAALAAAEGRLALLRRWLTDMSGTHPLLGPRGDGAFSSLDAAVSIAEALRIPAQWQAAIAGALGSALQAALLFPPESLPAIADEAQERGTVRMGVVALDAASLVSPAERDALLGRCLEAVGIAVAGPEMAVIGWAEGIVQDAYGGRLAAQLLARTIIVRDVRTALRCHAAALPGLQFVTLAGEVVLPTGLLLCGVDQGPRQLIEFHDEFRRLPEGIEALRRDVAGETESHAAASAAHGRAEIVLAAARKTAAEVAEQVRGAEGDVKLQERLRAAARGERARAAGDLEACQVRADRLDRGLADLEGRATAAREERVKAEAALAEARRGHAARLSERDALRSRRQAAASALALARQTVTTAQGARDRAVAALSEAERELSAKEAQHERLNADSAKLADAEARADERRRRVGTILISLGQSLPPARERVARARADQALHAAAIARREGEARALEATVAAADEASARAVRELEALSEAVEGELSCSLSDLPAPEGVPPGAGRVRALRARLAEFGNVNQRAVEDYDTTLARLVFLRDQANDLIEGISLLRGVIEEANGSVRGQFAATLATLEASFATYFRQLFCGGTCALRATYDAEGMPAGVEVSAQPPGKRAQDLALLSGGERALVALALLFAMLSVRPVPFCLLDEVEAALDESNTGRFVEILRSLSHSTQFVLITHNRGTMVQADSLYGITMSEGGISQVASLALRPQTPPDGAVGDAAAAAQAAASV